eukprot:g18381.t1
MDFSRQDSAKPTHPTLGDSHMCLFEGSIEATDILQGALGDCWLLAAMATLAEHEGAINSLFAETCVQPNGKYHESTWERMDLVTQISKDKRACAFKPSDEKHEDEDSDFFQLLRHYHRQGAVLCCGGVQAAGQKQGLVPKHAFSLLQVRAVPVNWHSNEYFRMVQIRNPWGTGEWKGSWCDGSPLWMKYPHVQSALDFSSRDDGTYWMQWEDFCKFWGYVGCVDIGTSIFSLRPPLMSDADPASPFKDFGLNGHRCNVVTEGWYCCENHRGRAKCPAQFPVMCDTLCSGITEKGSALLEVAQSYFNGRSGSWIWLLVLVPLAGGLAFYCYVRCKGREVQAEDDETLDTAMGMKLDKFGFFKAYKAENRERKETKWGS